MKNYLIVICLITFCINNGSAQNQINKKKFPKYEIVGSFNNGLAKVRYNKKWGYIDSTGAEVFPPKYNEVENFSDGLARVRSGTKWGLVDKNGKEIIKPTFDFIDVFIDGEAKVRLNGETYYMNKEGIRVEK